MTVAYTSQLAYSQIKNKLGAKQEQVYQVINKLSRASNEQIADYLDWPINRVTGRCTELRNFGLITVDGVTRNKSGASAKVWVVKSLSDNVYKRIANEQKAVPWLNEVDDCYE